MEIRLSKLAKRFAYEWIFRDLDFQIASGDRLSISGGNGAGKSTLMRLLLGTMDPSAGQIQYFIDQKEIPVRKVYQHISFAAPYTDIIDDFTLEEMIRFHFRFKKPISGISTKEVISMAYLDKAKKKRLSAFSSGMLQRLKLILAVASDSKVLFLDEPTTNLDDKAKQWFYQLMKDHLGERSLIIATNEAEDKVWCTRDLNIEAYKLN